MNARWIPAVAAAALAAGCATLEAPFSGHLESAAAPVRDCAGWLHMLDERVAEAGVRDAQEARVPGFPYLRVNRLLAALRPVAGGASAEAGGAALHALADRMLALDQEARRYEIMNLPAGRIEGLRDASDGAGLRATLARTEQCGRLLRDIDFAEPELRRALLERATVPDDYSLSNRIFGLYAIVRIAFAEGVRRHEEDTRRAFARNAAATSTAGLIRHAPPPASLTYARASRILARAAINPLGIPEPGESELAELLAAHAPSFEIEVKADFDRFGALRWRRDSDAPEVDGAQLAVYAHPAWTLYEGRVLLQLVYTIWFPERPPQSPGDILAGKLDGVTWRVTLAPDGEPVLYDTIHPCGCYHMFFPTPRARARAAPDGGGGLEEWMFSPQPLPRIAEGERPLLRVASGTHYIERVGLVRGGDSLARYALLPYGELRSLFRFVGPRRAGVFGADGLVPGSERPERSLFWPMGIASAGAMRQWGRQATAFIGRRHFDDADLIEKRFHLDLDRQP